MYCIRKIKGNTTSELIIIFLLAVIIPSSTIMTTTNLVYGQPNQMNFSITDLPNIQNLPAKKVHVGDIDIAYKIFGKGNSLLLISGAGNVMDSWRTTFLNELSSTHQVIIFDNRGVGNTIAGSKSFSIQQLANDTADLLDALKIEKADVLGFSMGSFVAQQLTIAYPEKVDKLILHGSSCGGKDAIPQDSKVIKIVSDVVNNRTQDEETILSLTFPLEWIKMTPNGLDSIPKSEEIISSKTLVKQFNAVEDRLATNWSGTCEQLQKIAVPTLVITGSEDVLVPSKNSLLIAEKVNKAWLVQINGAGQGLMYPYPEQLTGIVTLFLGKS